MRYAYATFLCRNDGYLPGALVLAYALRQQSDKDLVCLVTEHISENARRALGALYDKVIEIGELRFQSAVREGRSDRNLLLTRFQALRLGPGGGLGVTYDKIILLDADVLPLRGYDELFALKTPAGILTEPRLPHGAPIPNMLTGRVRDDLQNMGVNAGLWVLTPSIEEYNNILTALKNPDMMALTEQFPWPEMQLATLLWSGRWTNVDERYCFIGGGRRLEELYGKHIAGLKPWRVKNRSVRRYARYPDFREWYRHYAAAYWSYPALRAVPGLRRLWEYCQSARLVV